MFCKIQCIDITRFHFPAVSSSKSTANVGLPPPSVELNDYKGKVREPNLVAHSPNGELIKRVDRLSKHSQPNGCPLPTGKSRPNRLWVREVKHPHRPHNGSVSPRLESNGREVVNVEKGKINVNGVKACTKCSTKWASYGGCIPSMLQALEVTRDLDKAFQPWEETLSNKERTIILKEQSSWERALQIFQWFGKKGCYELNIIHYNIMLRILGKAKRWAELERLLDEMARKNITPVNSTYGTLIDVYTKGGQREKAVVWLQRMNDEGLEPDEVTMGVVLQMYKKAGEFEKAEKHFSTWALLKATKKELRTVSNVGEPSTDDGSQLKPTLNSYIYNTLIDTYGKSGQIREATKTFDQMLRDGAAPDTVTFNTMLHTCGNHGHLEEVTTLLHKMEQLKCRPDTRTYNILISLYAKHNDIKRAMHYFVKMKEASLEPDPVSYRTLLYALSIRHMVGEAEKLVKEMDQRGLGIDEYTQSALTRMYIEVGMLHKSWSWFERFHLCGNMTSNCYGANIDAYGERGHIKEAERVFNSCREQNKLGVVEFNVMIKAYGKCKKYNEACELFRDMKNCGVIPDRCTYVSMILMLTGADFPHLAKPYLLMMQEAGLVDDCFPYGAVISSFAKVGQLDSAVTLYAEMIRCDLQPDIIVYGALINAFTENGNICEALSYVETMKRSGLSLNSVMCKTLIKLYTRVGYWKEAGKTYELLKTSEDGIDMYSSNCMIDLYSRNLMVREAEEIFYVMERSGYANEFSYAMMLCLYKRIGRVGDAMGIVKRMQELGFLTQLLSFNTVLNLFAMEGRSKEAFLMFKEMIESGIQPDDSTFKTLGALLRRSGIPKKTVGELDVMWKRDSEKGLESWMSALDSVVEDDIEYDEFW